MKKLITTIVMGLLLVIPPALAQFVLAPGQSGSKLFSSTSDKVEINGDGCEDVTFTIVPTSTVSSSGTWNGVITYKATVDGSNWVAVEARNANTGALGSTATVTSGGAIFVVPNYGYNKVKAYPSSLSQGTANVTGKCAKLVHGIDVNPESTGLRTGTVSQVAISATSTTCLAANPSRRNAIFVNNTSQSLYLKYGATASLVSSSGAGSFTHLIGSGASLNLPVPVYTGKIDCIWSAATSGGYAQVTEVTN